MFHLEFSDGIRLPRSALHRVVLTFYENGNIRCSLADNGEILTVVSNDAKKKTFKLAEGPLSGQQATNIVNLILALFCDTLSYEKQRRKSGNEVLRVKLNYTKISQNKAKRCQAHYRIFLQELLASYKNRRTYNVTDVGTHFLGRKILDRAQWEYALKRCDADGVFTRVKGGGRDATKRVNHERIQELLATMKFV